MAISAALLTEFDTEMATMRKTLERVTDDKFGWKPHDRSMTMGDLSSHIANMIGWVNVTISADEFDLAPGGVPMKNEAAKSNAELLETLDKNIAAARAAIESASDEQLMKSWSLKQNGQTLLSIPKVAVLRSFVMNHCIHHRGQLSVYLRMNDIPVPSIYGPSADESPF
ncbi:MAG: DinB family protein [Acidobacteriota bacterium]